MVGSGVGDPTRGVCVVVACSTLLHTYASIDPVRLSIPYNVQPTCVHCHLSGVNGLSGTPEAQLSRALTVLLRHMSIGGFKRSCGSLRIT